MLFVVCIIVRFSSRKGILANFSHPSILGLAVWPGELRHLHGLATAESCWQSFGYKKHLGKGQRFLFSFFLEPEKRPKRIQKASAGTHWEGCPDPFSKFRTYSLCRSCWIGAGRLIHAPCFYRDHKKADQRRDSKEGCRWIPPIRPVLS